MKKLFSLAVCVLLGVLSLTGCSGEEEPYTQREYTAETEEIRNIRIEVRDRRVEVSSSADGKIHIACFENSKETYDISVSGENILTMTAVSNKEWTDYIGGQAPAEARRISVQVPDALLDDLSISTSNEDISLSPLKLNGSISLQSNGGNIFFDELAVQTGIALDVKNGNISGAISGSYDDFSIQCSIKKGKSNLPEKKESGQKQLTVQANNGDVSIDIR